MAKKTFGVHCAVTWCVCLAKKKSLYCAVHDARGTSYKPQETSKNKCAKATKEAYRKLNPRLNDGLSPGTVGAIAELVIAVDLMKKGYEVFRAMSPSASCDLLVCKGGKFLRIEAKTATRQVNGAIVHGSHDPANSDAVALYDRLTETVLYRPALVGSIDGD